MILLKVHSVLSAPCDRPLPGYDVQFYASDVCNSSNPAPMTLLLVKSHAYDVCISSKSAHMTCPSLQTCTYDASSSSKPEPMMSASVVNHQFPIHDNLATCPNLPSPNSVSSKVNFFHIFFLAESSIHNRTNAHFSSPSNIVLHFPTAIGCHSLLTQTYVVCLTYLIEILSHTNLP